MLRESQIRPAELEKQQQEAYERDIARVLERKSEFVQVDCPACGSSDSFLDLQKYGLDFLRCKLCRTLYQSPRPTPEILDFYYSTSENYKFWNQFIFPASEQVRREKIFRPRVRRLLEACARYGIRTARLIDVGAGFGTFCEEVLSEGTFESAIAVEPTPDLADSCRGRGLTVIDKPVEDLQVGELEADVVTAFEVVEHLFEPTQFLQTCYSLLAPGGLVVITCPNIEGFDLLTLKTKSAAIDLEHLNYFHPHSLASLLEASGFEVVDWSTPGELDAELVRKSVLAGEHSLAAEPFLRKILIDEWDEHGSAFQRYLASAGLSSHLWMMGRRR